MQIALRISQLDPVRRERAIYFGIQLVSHIGAMLQLFSIT